MEIFYDERLLNKNLRYKTFLEKIIFECQVETEVHILSASCIQLKSRI